MQHLRKSTMQPSIQTRHPSQIDHAIAEFDTLLRTLFAHSTSSSRPNPADAIAQINSPLREDMSKREKRHSAGLMRINHSGEVCAQALYQGQALTAKLPEVKDDMTQAAVEEQDHLAWCQRRLDELGSRPSLLNPLWYGLSLGLGAAAGAISDRLSLGFVAATEEQVCQHLDDHMEALPEHDHRSHAIVQQMREDEAAHGQQALAAGGMKFPKPVKQAMSQVAKVMTWFSYRI